MSEEKTPEIEFVLSPEQKSKAGGVLNFVMMSHFTMFTETEPWDWENNPAEPFNVRIVSGAGLLLIPLTDAQIVDLLKQVMDGTKERQAVVGEILNDVTE